MAATRPGQHLVADRISVLVPGLLYLGWGLWELAELPTWGIQ
ncbi:MAG: hypothetical protein WD041_01245 [Nitriliruptoraceae bacterium]